MKRRSAAALCLVLTPALVRGQQADTHAIVGARVHTVSGAVLERATIVMRDGLITAIGTDVQPPTGARVIDGTGLVVTPGLVDGLSSIGLPAPPRGPQAGAAAASGATPTPPPIAAQSLALDRVRAAEVAKARDRGITAALVIPREGIAPGQSALLSLSGDRPESMVLRQPAALHLHMATAQRQYPASLMGTMAYARQALLDAARAREAWAAWEKAPRGQKRPVYEPGLGPWQQVLAGRLPLAVTCVLENDVRRALSLGDEFGVKVVLAGAPLAYRVADLLKARRAPLLVSVNFDPPQPPSFFGFNEEAERRRVRDARGNPAELHRAGIPFALASAWAPDFVAGIRTAIENGLPREAALRAATLGAAEALGVGETLGSLEPGKLANVVAGRASRSRRRRSRATCSWTGGSTSRTRTRSATPGAAPLAARKPARPRTRRRAPRSRTRSRCRRCRPRRRRCRPGSRSRSLTPPS
jgi:imidazolonepropionase-like amidohydrolase